MLQLSPRGFQCPIVNRAISATKSQSYGTCNPRSPYLLREFGKRYVTMVTTTRGVPSTSTDLKEALCEKIPLHYDLLRKFRSQHGSSIISTINVNDMYNGLKGVKTIIRETSEIDPRDGIRYRGLTIPEVLRILPRCGKAPSPEAVFWFLLTGDVPSQEQTASLVADWSSRRMRKRSWWLESGDDSIVARVIRALPKNVTPLGKLSIALTALDAPNKHIKRVMRNGSMSYMQWEDTYEEGMEFLASLPAIVGLVRKTDENIIKESQNEGGDWVDILLNCSNGFSDTIEKEQQAALGNFLRLFIAVNADEDGGVPSSHVTQILGSSRMEVGKALASGVLAYSNEPSTGTLLECMEFQLKIQSLLGKEPNEEALKNLLITFLENNNEITGYKVAAVRDSRYTALSDFADEYLSTDSEIKLSKKISQILTSMSRSLTGSNLSPEQNTIAAPIFRFYGLKDMEFNKVLFCMSRALGAIASIIWTKAVDIPFEHPESHSTCTYINSFRDIPVKNKPKRRN